MLSCTSHLFAWCCVASGLCAASATSNQVRRCWASTRTSPAWRHGLWVHECSPVWRCWVSWELLLMILYCVHCKYQSLDLPMRDPSLQDVAAALSCGLSLMRRDRVAGLNLKSQVNGRPQHHLASHLLSDWFTTVVLGLALTVPSDSSCSIGFFAFPLVRSWLFTSNVRAPTATCLHSTTLLHTALVAIFHLNNRPSGVR